VATAGSHRLTWRYAAGDAAAPRRLDANGTLVNASLTFPKTGGWGGWTTLSTQVTLRAGVNTITLTAGNAWAYQNIDYLDVG
jgi:hypothetical protein